MGRLINSINKLDILEHTSAGVVIDYTKVLSSDRPKLTVTEDWLNNHSVYLEIYGNKYKVEAEALIRAVENAQRAHR